MVARFNRAVSRSSTPSRCGTQPLKSQLNFLVNKTLIWAMSRLSPLIVRRVGPRAAAVRMHAVEPFFGAAEPAKWLEDLKLFATGWIGGLIFFGTYLS